MIAVKSVIVCNLSSDFAVRFCGGVVWSGGSKQGLFAGDVHETSDGVGLGL